MPNGGSSSRLTLTVLKSFVTCLRIERMMLQEAASRQTREDGQQSEMPPKLFSHHQGETSLYRPLLSAGCKYKNQEGYWMPRIISPPRQSGCRMFSENALKIDMTVHLPVCWAISGLSLESPDPIHCCLVHGCGRLIFMGLKMGCRDPEILFSAIHTVIKENFVCVQNVEVKGEEGQVCSRG